MISPAIDASAGETMFEYARWYSNHTGAAPYEDVFHVSVSNNNGASWHPVETVGPVEQASGGWYFRKFMLGDFVSPSAAVRLRFDASDEGEDSRVEAAVDAVRFYTFATDSRIITEAVPSWTAGHPMTCQLEAAVCEGDVTWIDRLAGLEGTGLTLSTGGLLSGIPTRVGPVSFRAYITDQWGGNDEELLSFVIHPPLAITTTSIPRAIIDISYGCQLKSTGGTGKKLWIDRDGNLAGTGLTLSADGVLSGTPITTGTFPLVARITDDVGASAEKAYDLRITVPYVCGDANDDETVNVGDAVYLINFVFKSGSPPVPMCAGDANGDGGVNVGDAVYLISYIFRGGSPLSQTCCP